MTNTSSPTVWRRWLALELARLRQQAGLDQKDVAKALRCTVGKVSYYETAERPVVVRDLDEVLLPLYKVPKQRWPIYLKAARDSRQKGWWESYEPATLPPWFSLFVGLEQGASEVRVYEAQLVPGLLQTADYAEAVARRGIADRPDELISRHVELRLARQAVLRREGAPLRLHVVLDEAALRRVVGSAKIMREQVRSLAALDGHATITVQVLPYEHGAHPGMTGRFQIFGFPWPDDPGVAYIEHRAGALYLEEPHEIRAHQEAFERLCALSLSVEASITMLRRVAEEF